MARRPKKVFEKREVLNIGDYSIPVRVITERGRNGARASVTSQALIIRIRAGIPAADTDKQLREMLAWAKKTLDQQPEAFAQFRKVEQAGAYCFRIRDEEYHLTIVPHVLKHHKIIRTAPGILEARVNTEDGRLASGKLLPKLLAKYFGGVHLPRVAQRVHQLNDRHFQRPINNVRLSDTYSRWGSCSSKGNINLATRLVLAPDEILDAVIIHELAHLVEANHSPRFWAQVERALPNYKEYDVWLKMHGKELLFQPEAI